MSNFTTNYLESVDKQFRYYKLLGDQSLKQLSEADLFWQPEANSNAIAMIVKHLHGNMLSRWTNFLTEDGEKSWREREMEFEGNLKDKAEVLFRWETGWNCLFEALATIDESNFDQLVYIRNMGHTITEAINRQVTHYAYHVGQIVFIAKMRRGANWQSLSIPKGQSDSYNADKFAQEKRLAHFTDEFLDKE